MLPLGEPKFRRRKADRPGEIVAAAFQVFSEKGFAAAKLDKIAARAGVSKGAVYLYFETKEDIFRAVVDQALAPNLAPVKAMIAAHPGPFADLARMVLERVADLVTRLPVGGILKMVVGEARNFPEIARVWHDRLAGQVVGAITAAIAAAQARGEVRAGDPRLYALQLVAPIVTAVIWRETFTPAGAPAFDIPALARQHAETLLRGLAPEAQP